jgi:hypothetical protein
MSVAVGTIVAKNFLPFARVLARSFREQHPTVPFFTMLADRVDAAFAPGREPFETVLLEDLGIPNLRRLCFGYSRQQVSIAAKPYLLRYLLDRGFRTAIFLDADILVLDSLQPLFDAAGAHAITLTPHLIGPLSGADRRDRELNILQSGVYNGGFAGISEHASARRFLDWWADRLYTHCRHDVPQGMHYDQRWLDLVPALFDGVHIFRDASCNVAYWNLPERGPTLTPDGAGGHGDVCRFFHFSGFEPERPGTVTRYSNRLTMESIGAAAAALFAHYVERLRDEGYFECCDWPYGFGTFDSGVPIPDVARRLYMEANVATDRFGDPFEACGPRSYFRWLNEPVEGPSGSSCSVTRLWDAVYRGRPDLQRAFPDVFGADHDAFRHWIGVSGFKEHKVADAFAP